MWYRALVFAALCLWPASSWAAIAVDAVSTASGGGGGPFTFSHTVTGSNLALCVGVANYRNTSFISDVSYAGVSLTQQGSITNGEYTSSLWCMKAPATGTNTVSVTPNVSVFDIGIGAISFTGVDQTTPFGTAATASGADTSPTVNVSSATNELVVDSLIIVHSGTLSVGASQTQRWNAITGNTFIKYAGSTEPGAATTTMSWSNSTSQTWALVAVPLKPAAAVSPSLRLLTITGVGQ